MYLILIVDNACTQDAALLIIEYSTTQLLEVSSTSLLASDSAFHLLSSARHVYKGERSSRKALRSSQSQPSRRLSTKLFTRSCTTMPLPSDDQLVKLSQDLVGQLQTIFGKHPGFRPGSSTLFHMASSPTDVFCS